MTDRDRSTDDDADGGPSAHGLSIVEPPFGAVSRPTRDPPAVGAVLLAAGTSDRYGDQNKLLETLDGEPIVRDAVRTLLAAGIGPIVVVVGYDADRVREAVEDLPVTIVYNSAYTDGQATSVVTGIRALRDRTAVEAAVIALGDMPSVTSETVETLTDAYASDVGDVLAPVYEGVRGNPVLFDRRFFDRLIDVEGDVGGRGLLLSTDTSVLVAVDDPGVRYDVDVPGDLPSQ